MTDENKIKLNEQGEAVIKYRVNYYETDKMGVVHHSNYIRWFETVRVRWMDGAGIPYAEFEEQDIITPVTEIKLPTSCPSTSPPAWSSSPWPPSSPTTT